MALDGAKKVLHYAFSGDAPAHPAVVGSCAHGFNSVMLQATIAIFLLCGFESMTSSAKKQRIQKGYRTWRICSHCDPGPVLLHVRIFRGELLHEQRL